MTAGDRIWMALGCWWLVLVALVASTAALPTGAHAQDGKSYNARLSVVPIDDSMRASVTGTGSATMRLTGTQLVVSGTFEGLASRATVAQIHWAQPGVRGPVLFDLEASKDTRGTLRGTFTLTPAQVAQFERGWFYVQLHSEQAPDGNLWGWALPPEKQP
jgi:hypothetical protein